MFDGFILIWSIIEVLQTVLIMYVGWLIIFERRKDVNKVTL